MLSQSESDATRHVPYFTNKESVLSQENPAYSSSRHEDENGDIRHCQARHSENAGRYAGRGRNQVEPSEMCNLMMKARGELH